MTKAGILWIEEPFLAKAANEHEDRTITFIEAVLQIAYATTNGRNVLTNTLFALG
jgi:hypothetical protein